MKKTYQTISASQNGLRILLTQQCNYRCSFCHREGTHDHGGGTHTADEWMSCVILPALACGIRKITFSGGEPTLCSDTLMDILNRLAALPEDRRPAIKIVTNGSHFEERLIAALHQYPAPKKVHVSYHSAAPDGYARLTGLRAAQHVIQQVESNIRALRAANIPVTLNAVIIQGENDTPEHLEALMRKAAELDASAIQFIPMESDANDPTHGARWVPPEKISKLLMACPHIQKQKDEGRKTFYTSSLYPHLGILLTRCVCHLGCSHCLRHRDIIVDSDLNHHPCKQLPHETIPIRSAEDFEKAAREGLDVVKKQIAKYGDSSPAMPDSAQRTLFSKLRLLEAVIANLESQLERAEQARRDAQNDANAHLGRLQSRYDTFKEEAQYLAAAHERRIAEISQSLSACRDLYKQLTDVTPAAPVADSLKAPVRAGSLVMLCIQQSNEEWSDPFQIFLVPAGAGEKFEEYHAGLWSKLEIVACDSPLGRAVVGHTQGEQIEIPDPSQAGAFSRAYIIEVQ